MTLEQREFIVTNIKNNLEEFNWIMPETSSSRNVVLRSLAILYVLLVLYMPNAISDVTAIYHVDADPYVQTDTFTGTYPWLNYTFSFLSIIALLSAFFIRKTDEVINLNFLFVLLLIKNILRPLIGETNIFEYNDYAVIMALLTGYGCYLILLHNRVKMDLENILDMIIILNFATQIMFVLTGRQMEYGGRYAALGSGAGAVGEMCSQYLLYYIFARKSEKRNAVVLICCLLSLILSGSRTNLLMSIVFIILFAFQIKSGLKQGGNKGKVIISLIVVGFVITPLLSSMMSNSIFDQVIERMEESVQAAYHQDKTYFNDDNSMVLRALSFNAGFNILNSNPLGISSSAIDLQLQTLQNGYFSFPHSTLLSFYLLFGIGALICYGYIIKLLILAVKQKNSLFVLLLCISITMLLYGGPIQNPKEFFWYFVLLTFCRNQLHKKNKIIKLSNNCHD